MHFEKVRLEVLLGELAELPSDWMDAQAAELVEQMRISVETLRRLGRSVTTDDLTAALRETPEFLDVCRLFLGKGQEPVAHMLSDQLGGRSMTWSRLRSLAHQAPERMAAALSALDLPLVIDQHLSRRWRVEDILIERYKMSRGRAIAGQKRGRGLEDEVGAVLTTVGVPFARGVTFSGKKGQTAKCDFAIPTKARPKVVIEAKGFEATGSKLTDFLGDILKIAQAKDYPMYFFLVTDGRGWHNRVSDLKKIVEYQQEGLIDMIYTRRRLSELATAVRHIVDSE